MTAERWPERVTPSPRDENRRALIRLDRPLLNALLELPNGYNVVSVHTEPHTLVLVVESAHLAPQPFNQTLPALRDGVFLRRVLRHDGEVWVRWEWMSEEPQP